MSIIKIIGLSSLLLGSCFLLPAQNNYLVERFTTDNGLPSNGIKGLQWDQETGFLWIATEAGVTRYNGADFVTFSRLNTPELFSERMLFMLRNRAGRIYTADETGNIFFVLQNRLKYMGQAKVDTRPSTFKLTGLIASGQLFRQSSGQPPGGFGFNFSSDLLIPLSQSRLLLTGNDSLYDYRLGRPDPRLLTTVASGSKFFYLGGQLFVFDGRREFYRLDPDTLRKLPVSVMGLEDRVSPVRREKGDHEAEGQQRVDGGKGDHEARELRRKDLFWNNGMKYPILVSGSQAWLLDYTGGRLVARSICSGIPTDALLSSLSYDDRNGILFLGTNSKGIMIIRKNQVIPVKRASRSPESPTASYSQVSLDGAAILNSQGDILRAGGTVGGRGKSEGPGGGGRGKDGQGGVQGKSGPSEAGGRMAGLPVVRIPFNNFVLTTPDSILWYSTEDIIYSYSYRTHRTTNVRVGSGSITDGFALSGGNMYVANAIGVGPVRGDSVDYEYRYPLANINSNVPFSMLEISPGLLAIATCNGLFRYNTLSHRVDTLLQMPGICVRALWKYKGYLFIGTYGRGIFLYRDGKIRPIPLDKNGYLQNAHCFVPDARGFCWISTNKGLFRARPEDMTAAFDHNAPAVYYHYYGRKDGMEITELNGGCTPCALRLNDTVLSFPTMDGLIWVDPDGPVSRLPEGRLYIDGFSADGQRINTGSTNPPSLPSNTRELVFDLGFPAWANRENLRIQYRLDPYSKDWQALDIEPNPRLHFSNIPPGHYRLILRKPNGFTPGNYTTTTYRFDIEPHWYQQLWSWFLGMILFIALVIGIVRWRTRQFQIRQYRLERQIAEKTRELLAKNEELEKTDTIKTRLISIISHDLVTPLRFLHLTGKNLIEKKNGLTEDLQQEAIAEIATTSKELELLSTNILNWIKYQNEDRRLAKESFNLHEMVSQLFSIFNAMARQKKINLINQVGEDLGLYQFIEPVKIVLYNLILNGINFTSEGHIRISSSAGRDGIALLIEDTGVGMTQEQINNIMADHFIISSANVDNRKGNGLGYLIIKDLLKILRGSLHIQSDKDRGSRVTVWVPLQ